MKNFNPRISSMQLPPIQSFRRIPAPKAGFTLIEILVVVAIVGLLAGLAVVGLTRARDSAMDVKELAKVRELVNGCASYSAENNGKIPPNDSPAEYDYRRNGKFVGLGLLVEAGLIQDLNFFHNPDGPNRANSSESTDISDTNNLPERLGMSYSYRDCARFSPRPSASMQTTRAGLVITCNAGYVWNKPPVVDRDFYMVGYSDGSVQKFPRTKLQVSGAIPNLAWWQTNVDRPLKE
jgi:prepilin-type N-terminal cleavage/methylation domain-containing protein